MADDEKKWMIWSIEHDAWWRPNSSGYTHHVAAAGLYSFEEALRITAGANWGQEPVVDDTSEGERYHRGRPLEAMVRQDSYGKHHDRPHCPDTGIKP